MSKDSIHLQLIPCLTKRYKRGEKARFLAEVPPILAPTDLTITGTKGQIFDPTIRFGVWHKYGLVVTLREIDDLFERRSR